MACPLRANKPENIQKSDEFPDAMKPWLGDDFQPVLNLELDYLKDVAAYRKDSKLEAKLACRELNKHGRANYARFIEHVGRNIYPVIIANDHEENYSGVGTTFTLLLEDGTEEKVTPALATNYEVYKSTAHTFLQTSVLITPYFRNPTATSWMDAVTKYRDQVNITKEAVQKSSDETLNKATVVEILTAISTFLTECLKNRRINFDDWIRMNRKHFKHIKTIMSAATKSQADVNTAAMLKWKARLGPKLWRDVHVIIPTVWPVAAKNTRQELFRNILDPDRAETHIISSEFPRDMNDIRRLLGRVVGDRVVARFVFGDETPERKMKTYFLSSPIDVVMDDALPHWHNALREHGELDEGQSEEQNSDVEK